VKKSSSSFVSKGRKEHIPPIVEAQYISSLPLVD